MKDDYINGITKNSEFEDAMFIDILSTEDTIDRAKYIEDVRKKCREVSRLREFDNLLKAWITRNAQLLKQTDSKSTQFTDAPLVLKCGKWDATDAGISIAEITKSGDIIKYTACPHPILPVERLVNIDTDTEKTKIAFFKDMRWRDMTIDNSILANKSTITQLADRGVMVTSESAKDLVKYLSEVASLNMQTIPFYRSISRLGWIEKDFAPYDKTIKYDGDADFQSIYEHVGECGEYKLWLDHITVLRENINIRLMLSASFASVLIEKVGALPFVLHLWGTTGFGKTVSLMVASSIWGNPDMGCLTRSMNATANSIVRTASFLYSIPFCADEMQQIKDRWGNYDNFIMFVCEGIDRGKAKAKGGVEEQKVWKNAFIFTGEEPVTKANSGGGVKNRCIEIEVKDKIIDDGNKTANLVKENYGFAGKKFVEYLQDVSDDDIKRAYKEIFTEIIENTDTTEKQAMSMALILLADRYACECIFANSSTLSLEEVKEYLVSAKTIDMPERAYEWVVNWIAENNIRFSDNLDENKGAVWGKLVDNMAVINKNVLTDAMNRQGFDFSACSRKWQDKGRIKLNSQGYITHQTKVCGIKANYIKLILPDDEQEMVEVADKDNQFMQEQLPFD